MLALTIALAAALTDGERAGAGIKGGEEPERPNVVVLMTDDQTVESLRVMPQTQRLIADEGVSFANNFASNPLCCPSRSTYLTGQYAHNHGVLRNGDPNGGFSALDGTSTLPVWLQSAGYYTAHIGKYLNGYGRTVPTEVPPGWSEWRGSVDPSTYRMHGYTLNENGALTTYGEETIEDPATYQTDVYGQKAAELIGRRAPKRKPFFLSIAPLAPHGEGGLEDDDGPGPRAAPRHEGAFAAEVLPRPPSFNEADVSDKPEAIRNLNSIGNNPAANLEERYRDRLESLLAVDDMVATVVDSLRRSGELDDTLFLFTADNGFLLGEHRIRARKQYLYEESIRVPLIVRGPGVPRGVTRSQPVANIDLASTVLDYAGADPGRTQDGHSLREIAADPHLEPGRAILIENWCGSGEACFDPLIPRYQAVRTDRYLYAEYPNGEAELYDLPVDPYELESKHADPAYTEVRGALSRLLGRLKACAGEACRSTPRLKLDLTVDTKRLDGRRCTSKAIGIELQGADADEAISAELFADGRRVGADPSPPVSASLAPGRLDRGGGTDLRVNATVLDGRIESLDEKLPRRC